MEKRKVHLTERMPAVAGKFYPGDKNELLNEIGDLQKNASKYSYKSIAKNENIRALLVPHAGYVFSGTVAAAAFCQLEVTEQQIQRVFLIGSSHRALFEGASVYTGSAYTTPLGKVIVDTELCTKLIAENDEFSYFAAAHAQEHSIEVQLPFLQRYLKADFKIVPIVLGSQTIDMPKLIANILLPYFNPENLFIISTDLSHYPEYNEALSLDKLTINAFCQNSTEVFQQQLKLNEQKNIPHLSTSMCGWTAALTLLHLTDKRDDLEFRTILYQNSGDIPVYGNKHGVVGYQSVAIIERLPQNENVFSLNEIHKRRLIDIANKAIRSKFDKKRPFEWQNKQLPEALLQTLGAFVSVYVGDELRGCIGKIESEQALAKTIFEMAISAATKDSRFKPITEQELSMLNIEISILSALKKIENPDEIIPGKHGILIRKEYRSGTFLPQVAQKTSWSAIQLLEECSVQKAGLERNGWKDADVYTYEALVFSNS